MSLLENLRQDLRYSVKILRRSPGFAAVVLLSLTLGIGANTAIFQLLDAVGLRNLAVRAPQELAAVRLVSTTKEFGIEHGFGSDLTYPLWERIRDQQQAFAGIFAVATSQYLIGQGKDIQAVDSLWVSGNTFDVLGVTADKGRLFVPEDDRRDCALDTAVISHAFGQRFFGSTESAVGKTLTVMMDKPVRVIGVTPRDFTGFEVGRTFDVAFPMCAEAELGDGIKRPDVWWLTVIGRLKPDWTIARAAAQLDAISPGIFEATVLPGYDSNTNDRYRQLRLTAEPAANGISRLRLSYEKPLWLLLGITGLVLLIASVNLANLMLARASAREREIAIRIAVGASRRRLMLQLFCESLLLAALGAVLATALAPLLARGLAGFLVTSDQRVLLNLSIDWRVLMFSSVVAVITSVAFGLVPAFRSSHIDPIAAIKSGGRGLTAGPGRFSFQRSLTIMQIAVSLVLLFGALLFVQSLRNLTSLDTGFRRQGILFATAGQVKFDVPPDERPAFQAGLLDEIRRVPNVETAALTTHTPLIGSSWSFIVHVPNPKGDEAAGDSRFTYISPDYFRTMDTPLLRGRDFNNADTRNSRKVAIVNETFVRRYVSVPNPIGVIVRTVAEPDYPEASYEVIGVVKDTKYTTLRDGVPAIAYVPNTQDPLPSVFTGMVVRFSGAPAQVIEEIGQRIGESHPDMGIQFRLMDTLIRDGLTVERVMAWLSGFFGLLAAVLAAIGLYGVISFMVERRRNEIGVRFALGATRWRVIFMIVRETARLMLVGLAIGAPVSVFVTRALGSLLFELSPSDGRTLITAALTLAVIAMIASYVPAWRASRVDPMVALRQE